MGTTLGFFTCFCDITTLDLSCTEDLAIVSLAFKVAIGFTPGAMGLLTNGFVGFVTAETVVLTSATLVLRVGTLALLTEGTLALLTEGTLVLLTDGTLVLMTTEGALSLTGLTTGALGTDALVLLCPG